MRRRGLRRREAQPRLRPALERQQHGDQHQQHRRQLRRGDARRSSTARRLIDAGGEGGQAEVRADAVVGQRLHQRQRHRRPWSPGGPAAAPPSRTRRPQTGAEQSCRFHHLHARARRARRASAGRHRGRGRARTAAPRPSRLRTSGQSAPWAPSGLAQQASGAGRCTAAHRCTRRPARRRASPAAAAAPTRRRRGPESRTAPPRPPCRRRARRPRQRPRAASSNDCGRIAGQDGAAPGVAASPARRRRRASHEPSTPSTGSASSRQSEGQQARALRVRSATDYHEAMFLQIDEGERALSAQRRTAAVAGVSLAMAPGQIGVLIGPSGCGKTSLLRAVAGLETPSAGRISMGGDVLSDAGARAGRCRRSSAASAWCSRTTRSFRT